MARFADKVGFGVSTEVKPGEYRDVIVERDYYGDVTRTARQALVGEKVNDDLTSENTIEIVADSFASDNIFAIRYVKQAGTRWKVSNVAVEGVRLHLRLGGVYHGPTPAVSN